jgi:fructokinase
MASLIASVHRAGSDLLDRASLEEIGRSAARAAAITVSRAGADLPWAHEL